MKTYKQLKEEVESILRGIEEDVTPKAKIGDYNGAQVDIKKVENIIDKCSRYLRKANLPGSIIFSGSSISNVKVGMGYEKSLDTIYWELPDNQKSSSSWWSDFVVPNLRELKKIASRIDRDLLT